MNEDVVREEQPSTPLGHLADAMLELSNEAEVKAIVMLHRESEGMVALGGYDDDTGEAVADLFLYLQKLMAANGQELTVLDAT